LLYNLKLYTIPRDLEGNLELLQLMVTDTVLPASHHHQALAHQGSLSVIL